MKSDDPEHKAKLEKLRELEHIEKLERLRELEHLTESEKLRELERIAKLEKLRELELEVLLTGLNCLIYRKFYDLDSEENLDDKIRVLEALKTEPQLERIPGFEKAFERYPLPKGGDIKDGDIIGSGFVLW